MRIMENWELSFETKAHFETGHEPVVAKSYSVHVLQLTLIRLPNSHVWFKLHEAESTVN